MMTPFHGLMSLRAGRVDWRIKVRVIRKWNVESSFFRGKVSSIELILLDIDGNKIQATIPHQCVHLLGHLFFEHSVYIITTFQVLESMSGSFATGNRNRITFRLSTRVVLDDSFLIHQYGLTLSKTDEINRPRVDPARLVDFIGLLTALHYECVSDDVEGLITVGKIELTDERGSLECELKGVFLAEFRELLRGSYHGLPVVVLQFGRVNREGAYSVLEGVKDMTRLLFNPSIAEYVQFKSRLVLSSGRLRRGVNQDPMRVVIADQLEFNRLYPSKTIAELVKSCETGLSVVCGDIVGCFQVDQWWYAMCDCGSCMKIHNGLYTCTMCARTTFGVKSKSMLRVVVDDGEATATFELPDYLLQGITSLSYNHLGVKYALSKPGLEAMKRKKVLFIVKKLQNYIHLSGHPFEVIRLTNDEDIIGCYNSLGKNYTPTKCIFKPCVDDISPASALIPGANYGFGRFPSFGSSPSGFVVDASAGPSTSAPPSVHRRDLLPTFHGLLSVEEAAGPSV